MATANTHAVKYLKDQLIALIEVSKTLTLPLDLPELLEQALRKIMAVIGPADIGAVMLWDQSSGLFRPVAACGVDLQGFKQIGLRSGESITGKVFDQGKGWLVNGSAAVAEAMADMRPANRAVFTRS